LNGAESRRLHSQQNQQQEFRYEKGISQNLGSVRRVLDVNGIGVGAIGIAKPTVERFVGNSRFEHQALERDGKGWRTFDSRLAIARRSGE